MQQWASSPLPRALEEVQLVNPQILQLSNLSAKGQSNKEINAAVGFFPPP